MLNHGGIASSGHCVTFPQEINEPAKMFPRLPPEIQIIKVRKQGKNDTSKEFRVRRFKVQQSLNCLKITILLIQTSLLVMKGYNQSLMMGN